MYRIKSKRCLFPGLLFSGSLLLGQKIIHMNGSYDLDGDKRLEFISLELDPDTDVFPTVVRYYEMDVDGYQNLVWEFSPPAGLEGYFVDARIGDLIGNGSPNLIIVMNLSRFGDNATPHVFVATYSWDGASFSELPSATLDIGKENRSLRCNNFQLLDQDADGDEELILSLGSPFRGFAIVDYREQGLVLTKKVRPDELLIGSALLYVGVVDYDSDGYADVLAVSQEGSTLKAQPFYNIGGVFDSGHMIRKTIDGINGILPQSFELTDWDADGFFDVLAGFGSGDVIGFTLTPATLIVEEVPVNPGPLTQISIEDFNQDTYEDMLMLSSDINALTLVSGKDGGVEGVQNAMSNVPQNIQIFAMLPLTKSGLYTGSVLLSGWNGKENSLYVVDLGKKSDRFDQGFILSSDFISKKLPDLLSNIQDDKPEVPEVYIEVFPEEITTLQPQTQERIITDLGESPRAFIPKTLDPRILEGKVLKEQPRVTPPKKIERTLEKPKQPKPKETVGMRLPKHILPKYVLTPGHPFLYELPKNEEEEFYSFRWESLPPQGMYFFYESKAINWVPTEKQLDAFQISYHVRMKVDEIMEPTSASTEENQEYKALPVLESRDESMWIYVNDPPRFLTQPEETEFVAGTTFRYEPIVQDRNKDANFQFDLEIAPKGMILENGVITWVTDSSHVEVYDVRLVVSDGFDRTAQEFKLFARAGVRILSMAPTTGKVGENYTYAVKVWKQGEDEIVKYKLFYGPDGMKVDPKGNLLWTPNPVQVDTVKYALVAMHGVATDTQFVDLFVNHPPVIKKAPPPMNKVNVGGIWDYQLEIEDPNTRDQIVYTAHSLPQGMRMDPNTGRLRWEPGLQNIDFHKLRIEVSDGHESRFIESEFFVNAPIQIVSVPSMAATVGAEYAYSVMTVDKNRGSLLPFNKVVKVENVSAIRMYSVNITDDVAVENIDRYLADWHNADAVYYVDPKYPADSLVSRLNMKRYTHSAFFEENRLWVILQTVDGRTIKIKDFLWEFFIGKDKGRPPRVVVERISPVKYSLLDFPEGMVVDEGSGTIRWIPKIDQVDTQRITVIVSDGYTKDEQTFEVYANHLPTIVSNPPRMALVGDLFKYQINVDDKNENVNLKYDLIKGPHGMQMDRYGKILWVPKTAQINYNNYEVSVSDGYGTDTQQGRIFVNNPPTLMSAPKPVGLTGHTWRYKMTTEDLNKDRVTYRAVRLPKYAKFDKKKATIEWTPRQNQTGMNDFILMAIDEHGATSAHEFQVHVFHDPSSKQLVNTGWPLMLTFVGVVFAWGMSSL